MVALVGVIAALFVATQLPSLGPGAIASPLSSALAAAPSASPEPPPATAPATPPTGDQAGHPQLGGTGWSILEIDGQPALEEPQLHFWGGLGQGNAEGEAESACYFIGFRYSYDPAGPWLTFNVSAEDDGSYTDGCTPAQEGEYAQIVDALGRVTYWTMLAPDRLGLLGEQNRVMIEAGPPPPRPTAPPGGDCGNVAVEPCMEAAAAAFASGLFLESGQRIVSWRVRPTAYASCASGFKPVYDVVYELANPTFAKVATVGELYGHLVACGDY